MTFLDYFGEDGVNAVKSAMNVFNGLPASSSININNYLTDGIEQVNYTAQAGSLLDLKSVVMWLVIEHMGLIGETHVFDLHSRLLPPGAATCQYDYLVMNRNYDPVTWNPSDYVNGRYYTYSIWDGCPAGVQVGDAVELPYDTALSGFTAVATPEAIQLGGYYLGLTQDDVGGIKYLYSKNNFMFEALDSNSVALPPSSAWSSFSTNETETGISNFAGVLGGVEKVTFVQVNFSPWLGTNFNPITYHYTVPWISTNGRLYQLPVARTITTPDILFTAADLLPTAVPLFDPPLTRTGTFLTNGFASPGGGVLTSTINPQMLVTLNNVGALYYNQTPFFLSQTNAGYPLFIWGTFDGTTNAPIVYPSGTSLQYLMEQIMEGGATVPGGSWSPILNPNNTNSTSGGGTGTGGGTGGGTAG
jgi:hypothetical protein